MTSPKMHFFSEEFFRANRSHAEYECYWKVNRDRMPENLLRINGGMLPPTLFSNPHDAIDLHDARIESVTVSLPKATFHLHYERS